MSDAFIGEIRMFAGSFAPEGWAFCAGQPLPISDNQALYSVLGLTYGGDGVNTFNLPDLRGRIPIHRGVGPGLVNNYQMGAATGTIAVTLTAATIPPHSHSFNASNNAALDDSPTSLMLGNPSPNVAYTKLDSTDTKQKSISFEPNALSPAGSGIGHANVMPSFGLNFIICLNTGVYPVKP